MIDIEQRITAAIERITSGNAPMRVPADETDPDLVLADCLAEIRRLRAALSAQPHPPSSFDLEAMLAACVPGGDIADPQVIADNIRHWFAAHPSPGGQDALALIARQLRAAGASLPAPAMTGTIEGSIVTGLSIALALVEDAIAAKDGQR